MKEEGGEVVKAWEMGRLIATAGASGLIASAGHSTQERLIKNDGLTIRMPALLVYDSDFSGHIYAKIRA